MRRIMLAVALVAALIIPVATTAADPGPCGPDPAFGYRTAAGNAAARSILTGLGYGEQLAAQTGIDPAAVIAAADARQETILAGTGFFGDSVTHPYPVDYSAFSGIVGIDGEIYYAVRLGVILASERGDGSTDTAALYEKYLGSAQPTLSGTPCPIVTIAPAAPSTAVAPSVISRLRGYIGNLTRCDCDPSKLALYQARLDLYLAR